MKTPAPIQFRDPLNESMVAEAMTEHYAPRPHQVARPSVSTPPVRFSSVAPRPTPKPSSTPKPRAAAKPSSARTPARPARVSLAETLATLANVRRTLDRLEEPALARPSKPSRGLPPAEKAKLDRAMGLAGPEVSSDPARFTLSPELDLRALERSRPRKLSAAARADLDRRMRVSEPSSGVRNEGCRLILGGVK